MADNDRYIIGLVVKPKECLGCEYDFETCEITCEHNIRKGKTRAEYEDMIAETLWNKHYKVYLKTYKEALSVHDSLIQCTMDTVHGLAKAVVDRLFGENK